MPTSNLEVIEPVLRFILDENPQSILDVGMGFGKYGFLCREYLEILKHDVFKKEDWKVQIDGVEAFEEYISPVHRHIYNSFFIGDIQENLPILFESDYDLYIFADCLEHMKDWKRVLSLVPDHAGLVLSAPLGKSPQLPWKGNSFEEHIVTISDIALMGHPALDRASFNCVEDPLNGKETIIATRSRLR